MRAKRIDANHSTLVRHFRRSGASVVDLSTIGSGCPDLLIGFAGFDALVEIKRPVGARGGASHSDLNHLQRAFFADWRGHSPIVVRTEDEADALLDALAKLREDCQAGREVRDNRALRSVS